MNSDEAVSQKLAEAIDSLEPGLSKLPVIPLVSTEFGRDICRNWWLGKVARFDVDSIFIDEDNGGDVWILSEDREVLKEKWIHDHINEIQDVSDDDVLAQMEKWIDGLPWIRVFVECIEKSSLYGDMK